MAINSPKIFPSGSTDIGAVLGQVVAWTLFGAKPLLELVMSQLGK